MAMVGDGCEAGPAAMLQSDLCGRGRFLMIAGHLQRAYSQTKKAILVDESPTDRIEDLHEPELEPQFIALCAPRLGRPEVEVKQRIVTAWSKARFGFGVLGNLDLLGQRVREVGMGIGLISILLQRQGVDATSIEPRSGGFDLYERIGACLRDWMQVYKSPLLDIGAEALDAARDRLFDVIFLVNVFEHIPKLEGAVDAMCTVLPSDGVIRQIFLNHSVPYEPHFGVLLVPFAPKLSGYVLPRRGRTEVWKSLNLNTLPRIMRVFQRGALACRFKCGTLYEAFTHLERDPAHRERQGREPVGRPLPCDPALAGRVQPADSSPSIFAAPMTFEAEFAMSSSNRFS